MKKLRNPVKIRAFTTCEIGIAIEFIRRANPNIPSKRIRNECESLLSLIKQDILRVADPLRLVTKVIQIVPGKNYIKQDHQRCMRAITPLSILSKEYQHE